MLNYIVKQNIHVLVIFLCLCMLYFCLPNYYFEMICKSSNRFKIQIYRESLWAYVLKLVQMLLYWKTSPSSVCFPFCWFFFQLKNGWNLKINKTGYIRHAYLPYTDKLQTNESDVLKTQTFYEDKCRKDFKRVFLNTKWLAVNRMSEQDILLMKYSQNYLVFRG